MDANYIDKIDDATKDRLFDEILEMKRFTKPEEFGEYARRYLTKGTEGVGIEGKEWNEVGEYLLGTDLSNRVIGNILNRVKRRDIIYEERLTGASWDEKAAFINEYMKSIDKGLVIKTFDEYLKTRAEMEDESARAKIEARYGFTKQQLSLPYKGTDEGGIVLPG